MSEGLDTVFARHQRWAAGVRGAVNAWGLPVQCADEALHSPVLTGVIVPAGVDADALRKTDPASASTCRWARAWARSRAACSASATWATAMT